jgi:metallo-beta-lactamase family protein
MAFQLSFHGAAGTVTGSRHLLTTESTRLLVDAGLFQGLKELREQNWRRPSFDPASVDHLLLTHTHIDHAGYLPRLVRDGYAGPIHCTRATRELAPLLLMDAAKLQEEDAAYANRKGFTRHAPALPLYTEADAGAALGRLRDVDYDAWIDLGPGLRARFRNAGHILGSAMAEVRVERNGRVTTIVFSGDVGAYGMPLHPDPQPPPACDLLVVESTYGDRVHETVPLAAQMRDAVGPVLARGGTVLVPAFAVGRAQQVLLVLGDLMRTGDLAPAPIHVDSPMAIDATEIYSRHLRDHQLDEGLLVEGRSRLCPSGVRFHRTVEESKSLNDLPGPRVILSASGMLTGGRVLHHLARLLPNDRNLVLLVGYQAAGTRGRDLQEGAKSIRVHGRAVEARATIRTLHGLSGHADADGLVRWIRSGAGHPAGVFVTHGEPQAAAALAARVGKEIGVRTFEPRLGVVYDLDAILPPA